MPSDLETKKSMIEIFSHSTENKKKVPTAKNIEHPIGKSEERERVCVCVLEKDERCVCACVCVSKKDER